MVSKHNSQIQKVSLYSLIGLTVSIGAWACFTPDRAAQLALDHPDPEFVNMARHSHDPNVIPYFGPSGETPCVDGFADIFPCSNVSLVSHLPLPEIGGSGSSGSDSWGWEDPQTGIEYAIIGRSNGVAFVSLEDPVNPVYLGSLDRPPGVDSSVWADIKVYQDHAFMVADNGGPYGMEVFDLTTLRDVVNPPVSFSSVANYNGFNEAHNIAINEESGFAFATGGESCSGGLHMIDISIPTQPAFAGCFSSDGYTHDVQCVTYKGPDTDHQGSEICVASNEDTVTVVDVSDKTNPQQLARIGYAGEGYTHQGWFSSDQRFFVVDDELDESQFGHNTRTYVWDMSDLDNPRLNGFTEADGPAIDHNQYTLGNFTYQANYRRGLRILRLSNPINAELEEVAFFDTFPTGDGRGFSGAWNVYPFFDSGLVLVSDFNRGFFLVRPTPEVVAEVFTESFESTGP